jgi:hypothetical protein
VTSQPARWRCPECGREFGRRNQAHRCAPPRSLEGWLAARKPEDRATAEAVLDHLRRLGPVLVDAVEVGLLVKRARTFVELRPRRRGLRLGFLLSRPLEDTRVAQSLRLSAHRWAHQVDLTSAAEVDEQLRAWLTEAYDSSPQ